MNEKRNLNWCIESIEKRAFERGKRAGQDKPSKRWVDEMVKEIEDYIELILPVTNSMDEGFVMGLNKAIVMIKDKAESEV